MTLNADFLREFMIVWIDRIVYAQFYLVIGLSLFTVGLMLFRRKREQHLEKLQSEYADLFVNELLSLNDAEPQPLLTRPSKYSWLKSEALQETLLSQISSLSGPEREYAVKRYIDLGYAKEDIALCTSHYWWMRLEGVSHLNSLKNDSFGRVFNYMCKDENPLIALYSLLGLSVLQSPLNAPELLDSLSTYVHRQDNILLEITRNWSKSFGLEKLAEQVRKTTSVEFKNTFVLAICHLKTAESAPVIAEFLKDNFPAEVVAEMLQSLREIGDPSVEVNVDLYVQHENELVRQRALEFLTQVHMEIPQNIIPLIEKDSSPGVRRIYSDWKSKGQAA